MHGGMCVTFCELRRKDIICIADGRLLGRVCDLAFDPQDGRIRALIVACGGLACMFHGDKNQITIPWQHVACIGDDVILVSSGTCG